MHNFETAQPNVIKLGHEVDKQVSYQFVIDKFPRKHHLQLVLKQLLSATQNCSRKGINSKNNILHITRMYQRVNPNAPADRTCLRNTRKHHGKV